MNVLITGAGGYIGSSLIPYLQSNLYFAKIAELNTYDNFYYNQGPLVYNSLANTNFYKQDVLDWSDNLIDNITSSLQDFESSETKSNSIYFYLN